MKRERFRDYGLGECVSETRHPSVTTPVGAGLQRTGGSDVAETRALTWRWACPALQRTDALYVIRDDDLRSGSDVIQIRANGVAVCAFGGAKRIGRRNARTVCREARHQTVTRRLLPTLHGATNDRLSLA